MVSAGVFGVRKLDTFESSFVRLPFDSQSSEQLEYKEGNVLEQNLVLLREAKLDVILNDILRA